MLTAPFKLKAIYLFTLQGTKKKQHLEVKCIHTEREIIQPNPTGIGCGMRNSATLVPVKISAAVWCCYGCVGVLVCSVWPRG